MLYEQFFPILINFLIIKSRSMQYQSLSRLLVHQEKLLKDLLTVQPIKKKNFN